MRLYSLLFFTLLLSQTIYGQVIKVDALISENQITPYQNQKLFLIDFWATWCAPCIPATKQLEFIQEQAPDMIYMMSLSDENNQLIKDFLVSKPINLAVVSDFKKLNIKKYNIEARPYCVILDYKGNLLWEGKPSELAIENILKLYHKVKGENKMTLQEVILENKEGMNDYVMTSDDSAKYNSKEIKVKFVDYNKSTIGESKTSFHYNGSLKKLTSIFLNVPELSFAATNNSERAVELEIPLGLYNSETKVNLINTIFEKLELFLKSFNQKMMVYEWIVDSKKMLWDMEQLDWGQESPRVLVGNDRIQGDNLSITEITNELSNVKKQFYIYKGQDTLQHDWDFHYLYDDFMKEELKSAFGIKIDSTQEETKFYYIEDKK